MSVGLALRALALVEVAEEPAAEGEEGGSLADRLVVDGEVRGDVLEHVQLELEAFQERECARRRAAAELGAGNDHVLVPSLSPQLDHAVNGGHADVDDVEVRAPHDLALGVAARVEAL